jgi:hypothetical protein
MTENARQTENPPAQPQGQTHPPVGFDAVMGSRRGVSEAHELARLLAKTRTALMEAVEDRDAVQRQLSAAHARSDAMSRLAKEEKARAATLADTLAESEQTRYANRYAFMRQGYRDLPETELGAQLPGRGVYTPGRPYLGGEHAYHETTETCHLARDGGALIGEQPGHSDRWRRCRDRSHTEAPEPVMPLTARNMPNMTDILRQADFWWDRPGQRWALADLSDAYLLNVIVYLREEAPTSFAAEADESPWLAGCPTMAYASWRSWLADTPLMRALLRQRRRRGLRATHTRIRHDLAPLRGLGTP